LHGLAGAGEGVGVERRDGMRDKILRFVAERGGAVTFVELERFLGADSQGDQVLASEDSAAVLLWSGMSAGFRAAIVELIGEELIAMHETRSLVYAIDGGGLDLPVARGRYRYVHPRWRPVVLDLGEAAYG